MHSLPPFSQTLIRHTLAGPAPRDYLLRHVVADYLKYIIAVPAGVPDQYAVYLHPSCPVGLTHADLGLIIGCRVLSRTDSLAFLHIPRAQYAREVAEEVALAFVSYETKKGDILQDLPAYEREVYDDTAADYWADIEASAY